jgi:hypothetical protein
MEEILAPNGETIAILVRNSFNKDGINFISKPEYPLQVGLSNYKKGQKIQPHIHLNREIRVDSIQEVIYIKSGRTVVNLYDSSKAFLKSIELSTGDLIFFVGGGHGFDVLEGTTLIEVKQGPYINVNTDKEKF